jgi:hypothetical protein
MDESFESPLVVGRIQPRLKVSIVRCNLKETIEKRFSGEPLFV